LLRHEFLRRRLRALKWPRTSTINPGRGPPRPDQI
jgi:hypothetical protein